MSLKLLFGAATVAALVSPVAFADPAPDGGGAQQQHRWHTESPEQMAQWHTQMCKDRYAREAGKLAYLQAALSITDAQRGAFDQWRDAKLSAAKEHSDACLAHAPMRDAEHGHGDALEHNAREVKMLEGRLAELKSERPALEALYSSLSPEQKKVFDRAAEHGHHHHMGGERFGEGREGRHDRG
jgi:hypothetical protein